MRCTPLYDSSLHDEIWNVANFAQLTSYADLAYAYDQNSALALRKKNRSTFLSNARNKPMASLSARA